MQESFNHGRTGRIQFLPTTILCLACVLINLLGVQIATRLNLPLYLDCIGIIIASAVGGYIPGIIVGFFSNIINGLSDNVTVFYSLTSILIAVASAWFAKRQFLRRFPHILAVILALALIGGGIGSVLTWFLFGGGIGEGFTSHLATTIYQGGVFNEFFSQFSADFLYDMLDKTIEVLLAALILMGLSGRIDAYFPDGGLQNRKKDEAESVFSVRKLSLQHKFMMILAVSAIIMTSVVTGVSFHLYHDSLIESESVMAFGVANAVAGAFDVERTEEYMTLGENAPGYAESEARMQNIADSSENIAYVYVYKIQEDGCHVVFDPDTSEGPGSDPGTVVPFDDAFADKVPDLLAGREISPTVSNESYGWLLSVYLPMRDAQGVCRCYVGVDIMMRELSGKETAFLSRVLSLFLSFFIMILAIGAWLADHGIIRPINRMSNATMAFAKNLDGNRENSLKRIQGLTIQSGDEIENLYGAILENAEETVQYSADVKQKSEQISQMHNGLIMVLADLVESRDECTGNHIRNTAAYARLILEKLKEKGEFSGEISDGFIMDVFSSAPLHDVGKIHIPDAVLNKPGKLTDEEFTLMKTHTTAGGEIIDQAIAKMPAETAEYLLQARNVSLYHHERWDGRGYPNGLKGDEIPLSARVMAVADVFDALVSKRSYKEGFPFEKAISIIQEESGTHFDPKVVDAFMACEDEVRKISEENRAKEKKA